MTFQTAYDILASLPEGQPADKDSFDDLVQRIRRDWLAAEKYEERLERHRKGAEFTGQIKTKLADAIVAIQHRPEMRATVDNVATYVPSLIRETLMQDRRLRSLYAAVARYCEEQQVDFRTVAVHIAEYRAMNQLYNQMLRKLSRPPHAAKEILGPEQRVRITGTIHQLDFHKLSAGDFERLCFAYAERRWQQVSWLGQTGGDGGMDIWVNDNGVSLCLQCANYLKMTFLKAKSDIQRLADTGNIPFKLITVCSSGVSRKLRDRIIAYATSLGVKEAEVWSGAELEEKLHIKDEDLIDRYFFLTPLPTVRVKAYRDDKLMLATNRRLFREQYRQASTSFVNMPCAIDKQPATTAGITLDTCNSAGALIIGNSGCGKSMFARKLAVSFVDTGGVAVIAEAKYYQINLSDLLEGAARAAGWSSIATMLETCETYKVSVLIVLDGLNECTVDQQHKIWSELKLLPEHIKKIITKQEQILNTSSSPLSVIEFVKPDDATKHAIAMQSFGGELSIHVRYILKAVNTCLEAAIVGSLGKRLVTAEHRFELMEAYVRDRLSGAERQCMNFMTVVAEYMSAQLSFSLPLRDAEIIIDRLQCTDSVIKTCINAEFLKQTVARISFAHEIYQEFFAAESIIRNAPDAGAIKAAIIKPRYHRYKVWIAGAALGTAERWKFLEILEDENILRQIHVGVLGKNAKDWLDRRIESVLNKIHKEVQSATFEIKEKDRDWLSPVMGSLQVWEHQEVVLMHLLATSLTQGEWLDELFALVGDLDQRIGHMAKKFRQELPDKKYPIFHGLFEACYHEYTGPVMALNIIFRSLSTGMASFDIKNKITDHNIEKLVNKQPLSWGRLYLLLLLSRYDTGVKPLFGYMLNILRKNWKNAPYHVNLLVLENIVWAANGSDQETAAIDALQEMLQGLSRYDGRSLNLYDSVLEALTGLGALDDDLRNYESTVDAQIAKVLNSSDDATVIEHAGAIYYNQFEEPIGQAFSQAVNRLTKEDKIRLYGLALQGPYNSFFTVALIKESSKLMGAACTPLLIKWTKEPFPEAGMIQAGVSAYINSHILLGMYGYHLEFDYSTNDPVLKAMLAVAELYYRVNLYVVGQDGIKSNCKTALEVLCDPLLDSAVGAMREVLMDCRFSEEDKQFFPRPIQTIYGLFDEQFAIIARNALLSGRPQLTHGSFDDTRNILQHAISLLGEYGIESDTELLRSFVDSEAYGSSAIDAIRQLSRR